MMVNLSGGYLSCKLVIVNNIMQVAQQNAVFLTKAIILQLNNVSSESCDDVDTNCNGIGISTSHDFTTSLA